MSLQSLPAELRLHIYEYLSGLRAGRHETVAPHIPLAPPICRTSKWLRDETLSVYARNAHFTIQADEDAYPEGDRISVWLRSLGKAIKHVRSFQLSRHWMVSQPTRWQGHVGFYVRLEVKNGAWETQAGTYPIAGDLRGMRRESVQLLQYIIRQNVVQPIGMREAQQLSKQDVLFVAAAMNVVATHPLPVYDIEQSELGRQRRRKIWSEMEQALFSLQPVNADAAVLGGSSRFFTPY